MVKNEFIRERNIGEYLVTLPEPPPLKEIHNYGLKTKDQKFPIIQPPKNYDLLFGDEQKKYSFPNGRTEKTVCGFTIMEILSMLQDCIGFILPIGT